MMLNEKMVLKSTLPPEALNRGMTAAELIRLLQLKPHPLEGGYFRRTYESSLRCDCGYGERKLLTSIYYLLTQESPVGLLHKNRSDILHYHQRGAAVKYILISPDGSLSEHILGPDIAHGETLQLLVPGGWWKASRLCGGEYALISEAVAPGFVYADNEIATEEMVRRLCPEFSRRNTHGLTSSEGGTVHFSTVPSSTQQMSIVS